MVSILLDPFDNDTESLRRALSPGEPLHQTLLDAPPNWIEALAVLVPERFGIELLDTADWDLDTHRCRMWTSTLGKSVCVRRPSAVTERTVKLLYDTQKQDTYSEVPILEILLSVATQPQHLLNAYWLHKQLKRMSMPDRDVVWSRSTYNILDEGGPLDRLIRWASRSPAPGLPSRGGGTRRDDTDLDVYVTEPYIARSRNQSSVSTPLGAPVSAADPHFEICRGERSLRD